MAKIGEEAPPNQRTQFKTQTNIGSKESGKQGDFNEMIVQTLYLKIKLQYQNGSKMYG